jgi:hypothetical protein
MTGTVRGGSEAGRKRVRGGSDQRVGLRIILCKLLLDSLQLTFGFFATYLRILCIQLCLSVRKLKAEKSFRKLGVSGFVQRIGDER